MHNQKPFHNFVGTIYHKGMNYKEGFKYKGWKYAWSKGILYRLPTTKNKRKYGLKQILPIIIYSCKKRNVSGFRIARDKKTLSQVKELTKEVSWIVNMSECKECA